MKRVLFTLIFALITSMAFSQYAVLTLWKYEARQQSKEIILNQLKENASKRIVDGNLEGFHVWEAVNRSESNKYDLIIAELYENLEDYYNKRGLQNNLDYSTWKINDTWSRFLSSKRLIDRIIIKNEIFSNTMDELPNLAIFNFFQKTPGRLGEKWVEGHKKFAESFIKDGNRDGWGSWSIIHKSYDSPFDHLTIDLYDYKNEMEFIMRHNNTGGAMSSEAIKFWGKDKVSEARKWIDRSFYEQMLIL